MLASEDKMLLATPEQLVDSAKALIPALKETAEETERNRSALKKNMQLIKETGFFRVVKPARFGGLEYDFEVFFDATTALAAGCASTAWCAMITACQQWALTNFPLEGQEETLGSDPDLTVTGSYPPTGTAVPEAGGMRISGRWAFASGCDHAAWAIVGAVVSRGPDSYPAFCLMKAGEYDIDDNWFTNGLCGTGSKTLVCKDLFVPQRRIISVSDAMNGTGPGVAVHPNKIFGAPLLTFFPTMLASTAVGAAKGALADYVDKVKIRETRGAVTGGRLRMGELATIQLKTAEAAASTEAAELILKTQIRRVTDIMNSGRVMTVDERIRCRRDHAYAIKLCLQAMELLNAANGGQGLNLSDPIQRAWRDVNGVGRHLSLNWDAVGTMVGQNMLGAPVVGQY